MVSAFQDDRRAIAKRQVEPGENEFFGTQTGQRAAAEAIGKACHGAHIRRAGAAVQRARRATECRAGRRQVWTGSSRGLKCRSHRRRTRPCLCPASTALKRFKVLDLTRVRAGPTCVRQLADWGANVIKIEAPVDPAGGDNMGGPRHGSDFQNLHRNKRALSLNLKDPAGLAFSKTRRRG